MEGSTGLAVAAAVVKGEQREGGGQTGQKGRLGKFKLGQRRLDVVCHQLHGPPRCRYLLYSIDALGAGSEGSGSGNSKETKPTCQDRWTTRV
jgi:hypothetical protein